MTTWIQLPHYAGGGCATKDCTGKAAWRLEAGDIGSDHCPKCKEKIDQMREERAWMAREYRHAGEQLS